MKAGLTNEFVRVSTWDKNEVQQLVAMKESGVSESSTFMDKQPGRISTGHCISCSVASAAFFVAPGGCIVFALQQHSHEAIIPPETFKRVQLELARRIKSHVKGGSVFFGRIICGDCGQAYGPKVWHSTDKYRKVIWRCNDKFKGQKCATSNLTEAEVKAAFERLLAQLAIGREERIANLREIQAEVADTADLEQQKARLEDEREANSALSRQEILRNAQFVQDQKEYNRRYDELAAKDVQLNAEIKKLDEAILERHLRAERIDAFINTLETAGEEFSEELWCVMVERVTIHPDGKMVFTLACGMDVEV